MKIIFALIGLVGAVVAHIAAIRTGLYTSQLEEGMVWFDNLLHGVVGFSFGILWLALIHRYKAFKSPIVVSVSLIVFVTILAGIWEAVEYLFYVTFKDGTLGIVVYAQPPYEALFDSLSNIAGAIVCVVVYLLLKNPFKESTE